jgi:hypothetical protein
VLIAQVTPGGENSQQPSNHLIRLPQVRFTDLCANSIGPDALPPLNRA